MGGTNTYVSDNIQTGIQNRIDGMHQRVQGLRDADMYFYNMPVSELKGSSEVVVSGRTMLMLASYGYLGLLGHPRINEAASDAIAKYGSGTHGVRVLAGTLDIHVELEKTIADFKNTEDAVTFSSGYVTNLAAIFTIVGRRDIVL